QQLHVDFGNNTLVFPRDEGPFTQTGTIVYLSDVTEELAPTCVVSKERTGEPSSLVPSLRPRDRFPVLYEQEVRVTARAGSVLLYSMSTFHRGSAFRTATGARFTFHVVFRAKDSHWMGFSAWARAGQEPALQRFLERATPRQRELLGFPPPGHPYWNEETHGGGAGGLASTGGIAAGLGAVIVVAWVTDRPAGELLDAIVPAGLLALAIGRVGCFLAGCCHGRPTTLPWGVVFPGLGPPARHP